MIYGIDSFTILQSKESVIFVRVGDSIGWYSFINGKQYGDYIKSEDKITSSEQLLPIFEVLCDQAAATITQLSGRDTEFQTELAFGLREQVKQAIL